METFIIIHRLTGVIWKWIDQYQLKAEITDNYGRVYSSEFSANKKTAKAVFFVISSV